MMSWTRLDVYNSVKDYTKQMKIMTKENNQEILKQLIIHGTKGERDGKHMDFEFRNFQIFQNVKIQAITSLSMQLASIMYQGNTQKTVCFV